MTNVLNISNNNNNNSTSSKNVVTNDLELDNFVKSQIKEPNMMSSLDTEKLLK